MSIENGIKSVVLSRLEQAVTDDLQKLMDKVVSETLKSVKSDLGVKLVPVDKETFKFEFYWKNKQ